MSSAIGIVVSVVVIVAAGGILLVGLGGFKFAPKWLQRLYAKVGRTHQGYRNWLVNKPWDYDPNTMRYEPEHGTYVRRDVLPMYQRQAPGEGDGVRFTGSSAARSSRPNGASEVRRPESAFLRDAHDEQLPMYTPRASKPPSVHVQNV